MSYVQSRAERGAVGFFAAALYVTMIVVVVVAVAGLILALVLLCWLVGLVVYLAGKGIGAFSSGSGGGKVARAGELILSAPERFARNFFDRRDP